MPQAKIHPPVIFRKEEAGGYGLCLGLDVGSESFEITKNNLRFCSLCVS